MPRRDPGQNFITHDSRKLAMSKEMLAYPATKILSIGRLKNSVREITKDGEVRKGFFLGDKEIRKIQLVGLLKYKQSDREITTDKGKRLVSSVTIEDHNGETIRGTVWDEPMCDRVKSAEPGSVIRVIGAPRINQETGEFLELSVNILIETSIGAFNEQEITEKRAQDRAQDEDGDENTKTKEEPETTEPKKDEKKDIADEPEKSDKKDDDIEAEIWKNTVDLVLDSIISIGEGGATAEEISEDTNTPEGDIKGAFAELEKAGKIKLVGKKPSRAIATS